jgi:rhamnosyltransferase
VVEGELAGTVIRNGKNLGIATALNQGVRWAAEKGYQWVLTLDHDTVVDANMIDTLVAAHDACDFSGELAIVAANFRHAVNNRALDDFRGDGNGAYKEIEAAITSGSLTSVKAFREVGGFRDDFFLDCVDFEYCLRARQRGFRIILTRNTLMDHSIGELTEHWLLWGTVVTTNYNPIRHYFMARNILLMARQYMVEEPWWLLHALWVRAKSPIGICLFEDRVGAKLRFYALGIFDGLRGKTGRFS